MIAIPDANTLIYLAKADMLEILDHYQVWIGDKVYQEAVKAGKDENRADAFILEKYIEDNFEKKEVVDQKRFVKEKRFFKGEGETDVYLLAEEVENREYVVITSDAVARRKLKSRGIEVIRSDMLIFREFQSGKYDRGDLYQGLTSLRSVGGTTDQRISFLMNKAEELEKGDIDE